MASGQRGLTTALRPDRRIDWGTVSLQRVGNGGITGSIPVEKCRHAGVDTDDPGVCDWAYIRDQQLLVIDLGGQLTGDADE